ncbi:helix-turn-helix transcriptional regulator [filamentous cyanobacterium LEGE 11480]|uniref:Helix-turn-helix transcriptional regulator n=1 Tax=Romeriopsis navalis LEGE 11480 TaxID=2777977 RepID=A0A928VGK4_9CYAN|nr:AraC family transcriptional regulator [Romeriopsis navalis]MBE9028221.1 helix-turn-helix transcriptional regulator [Romeriopsis navalis LEGE 11480]
MTIDDTPPAHVHLVDSFQHGWQKLNLIYEHEPPGEMPEAEMPFHMVVIAQGDFHCDVCVEGTWRSVDYAKGGIAILPASELFPRTLIDREVPLLELFLHPTINDPQNPLQLEPQWNIRDPLVEQMGLSLQQELLFAGAAGAAYADSMAIALSTHLHHRYGQRRFPAPRGKLAQWQVKQLRDYIQANLAGDLTIDRLATLVQLSPGYFATLFKRTFGNTPYQYVLQCRMQRAQELLRASDLPIVQIADRVGFQTQSHFTRLFRQQVGMTPRQYRQI